MALLFLSHMDDPVAWRAELEPRVPDLDFRVWPDTGPIEDIDIALAWRPPPGELARYPNLRAIIALGAGVDQFMTDPDFPRHLPLARIVDPELTFAMSEYVLLAVLRHHRGFDVCERDQRARQWNFREPPVTARRSVGIMGLGQLGADAARRLADHGFRVRGWSRTPRRLEGIETFHGSDGLDTFLSGSEILVCLLPLTPATRNILDQARLSRLPAGSFVINPSRGDLLVEEDLVTLLDSGHLAGATLDVFRHEPLPADSPLWDRDDVLVTPHIASIPYPHSSAPQVAENIARARRGDPLLNPVDPGIGY